MANATKHRCKSLALFFLSVAADSKPERATEPGEEAAYRRLEASGSPRTHTEGGLRESARPGISAV